jgi:hypothetical protein
MERNARVSLVFLDACRDNPLANNLTATSRSTDVTRGLARVERAVGMMIAFSTQPGNVALDGDGRNSPFTNALLHHIDAEGTSINDMMIEVRNDVLKETDGKQVPWENSSLTGQFFFKPAVPKVTAETSTSTEIASLREQIAKLQTDQGAQIASQQEQLKLLQQQLAAKTGEADAGAKPAGEEAKEEKVATSRVIAVEPSESKDTKPVEAQPANQPDTTKVAIAEPGDGKPAEAIEAPNTAAEGLTREQLVADIIGKLSEYQCYQGPVTTKWNKKPQAALKRFNELAKLDLSVDEPEPETLAALKDWKGDHCTIEAAIPKGKPPVTHEPAPPKNQRAKAPPSHRPSREQSFSSPPPSRHDHVGDEQRELQRAFPSTNWPGAH